MKTTHYLSSLVLVGCAIAAQLAGAVCLDPKTGLSGYHLPLDEEIQSTQTIVIGNVVKVRMLQEDQSDPDGITAFLYTVNVLRQIKGKVPRVITLRVENDSGRYIVGVGEQHLLFLGTAGEAFRVNACGNSLPLPKGSAVLERVEEKLGQAQMRPNPSLQADVPDGPRPELKRYVALENSCEFPRKIKFEA